MSENSLKETVTRLATPLVQAQGLEIWGVEIAQAGRTTVRVFVDLPLEVKQAQAALSHQPFQPPPGADLELEGLVSQEDLDLLKRLYLEGMTYEELAAEENLNQNTLAARVRRIKLRFQKIYREIEHFSDPPCKKSDTARHKEKRGGSKL